MMFNSNTIYLIIGILFVSIHSIHAQNESEWDNLLFVGNKVSWGKGKFKTSGELQFRVKDNLKSLDRWFLEGIGSYLASKKWEITLPLRYSVRPTYNEFRPGIGVLYKMYPGKTIQISHQVLYQLDINQIEAQDGLRYVVFYNQKVNEHLIPNAAAGLFYRWSEQFTGIQFVRFGAGLTYIVNEKHTINFSYFLGISDTGSGTLLQGIPFFQLIINLGGDYDHLPAKYINF